MIRLPPLKIAVAGALAVMAAGLQTACGPSGHEAFSPRGPDYRIQDGEPVSVEPSLDADLVRSLPANERVIGRGEDSATLGELKIENPEVTLFEGGTKIGFRGRATAKGKSFEIEIAGEVDAEGTAELIRPDKDETVKVRGRATCLDVVDGRFVCSSLFVDVYVRINGETFTEQYTISAKPKSGAAGGSNSGSETKRPDASPRTATASASPQGGGGEGAEIVEETEGAEAYHQHGHSADEEHVAMPARGGRFVGHPNAVSELFAREASREWVSPFDASHASPPVKDGQATSAPRHTSPSSANNKPSPSAAKPGTIAAPHAPAARLTPASRQGPTPVPAKPSTSRGTKAEASPRPAGPTAMSRTPAPSPARPSASPRAAEKPAGGTQTAKPTPANAQADEQETTQDTPDEAKPDARATPSAPSQAYGCYAPDITRGCLGGFLKNASALDPASTFYHVLYPGQRRYYGTRLLVDFIDRLGRAVNALMPSYRLAIGDLSAKNGGRLGGHSSHQNGLDADIGYLVSNPNGTMPAVVNARGAVMSNLYKSEQWLIFKRSISTGLVSQIFVHASVKRAFCQHARQSGEFQSSGEVLRRLRPWPRHGDHWHVRLRCPSTSPRCQDEVPPRNHHGCA